MKAGKGAMNPRFGATNSGTQPPLQLLQVRRAGIQPRAVLEYDQQFRRADGVEFANAIQVDESRAMDARKAFRLQAMFHFSERRAQQVRLRADVQPHVVAIGFNPIDLRRANNEHAIAIPDQHPCCVPARLSRSQQLCQKILIRTLRSAIEKLTRTLERLCDALFAERFEQVIQRLSLEGLNGKRIES